MNAMTTMTATKTETFKPFALLNPAPMTHEGYIQEVRKAVIDRVPAEKTAAVLNARMMYGRGERGLRGITCFGLWEKGDKSHDVVEICLHGEESVQQLAGTTIHELAHVVAGWGAGHGKEWKDACKMLGLPGAKATSTDYSAKGVFDDATVAKLAEIPTPTDGKPNAKGSSNVTRTGKGGCKQGTGTKGGTSTKGSRLKKVVCPACDYTARITKQWIEKGLPTCPCGTKMATDDATVTSPATGGDDEN